MKEEIYKKLAATGKYYNTGKVLIGVQHEPRTTHMTPEGEFIQSVLLGDKRVVTLRALCGWAMYLALLVAIFILLSGAARAFA